MESRGIMSDAFPHLLENMSFEDFRDWKSQEECPVVLVPLGSQEIQGPAVPMGDFMLTRRIAHEVALKSGAVAAPTLPFGYAEYFRSVPGGIALSAESFRLTLRDILDNLLDHGLERLVILNGHSGNYPLIDQVIRAVRKEANIIVPCINLWRSVPTELWQELHGEFGIKAFAHGGDPITSVYFHYFPELTRPERIRRPGTPGEIAGLTVSSLGGVRFRGVEIGMPVNVDDACADGIMAGDPTRSSAQIGERIAAHLVAFCCDFVAHIQSQNLQPPIRGEHK